MFSFVIYDKNKLILSRDWVGKIPLYIHNTNRYIIASEVKSILTQEGINDIQIVPKNTLIEINLDTDDFKIHENFYFQFLVK